MRNRTLVWLMTAAALTGPLLAPRAAPARGGCKLGVSDFKLRDGGRTLRSVARLRCEAVRENVLLGITVYRLKGGGRKFVEQQAKTAAAASRLRVRATYGCRNGRYLAKATFIRGPGRERTERRTFRVRGCA